MQPVEPIFTIDLFPGLSAELTAVLRSLREVDWQQPTVCAGWAVRDVAAHLLGGSLGRVRDVPEAAGEAAEAAPTFDELTRLIDAENAAWVQAARRIAPSLLVQFLELADERMYCHFQSLDPHKPARIAVVWAGDAQSPNWFDIAREYTEKWLHQQHIRQAVGRPLLTARRWLHPVLDTFARALPYTYRQVDASDGAAITLTITGEAGGSWTLLRQTGQWLLYSGAAALPGVIVRLDQDTAWRLFTRGISAEAARSQVQIEGDQALGTEILHMVSIMA